MVYGLCSGFKGSQESLTRNLQNLASKLTEGAVWYYTQHEMKDLTMLVTSISIGVPLVRVGFEDSPC